MSVLAAVLLTGCAYKGRGSASYSIKPVVAGDKAICCEVAVLDSKESGELRVRVTTPDGTVVEYDAAERRAFVGQAIEGEVEKALIEAGFEATDEMLAAVSRGVTRGLIPVP